MAGANGAKNLPIVIVEDLHQMRKAIRRTVEREYQQVEIEEFTNAQDAIAYLSKHPVQLIISDIYMPKGDGFDLLRYVRSRVLANDIPVIFISGEATKDDIVHSADLGVTDYIMKPFEPNQLTTKVKSVLERYHNPSDRVQMLRTAESWLLLGDIEQARGMFQDLYAIDPKSPRVICGLAQVEVQLGNKTEALELVSKAIEVNNMYFPAYTIAGNLHIDLGNINDAIEILTKELAINGKQPGRRAALAELHVRLGDYPKAAEQLRLALLDSPKDENLLIQTAELYFQADDHEKAIHYYLKTRRSHPKSLRALEGVYGVAMHMGKPIRALHAFTDLVKLNPNQKDIYYARSRVYEKMDDYTNALADIDLFLGSQPDSIEGWQSKARILAKLDKTQEAIEVWKKIVQLAPTAENYGKLGVLLLKVSNWSTAAAAYEKALQLSPNNSKFLFNLACAYENLDQTVRAIAAYEAFLRLVPNNGDAQEALARLKGSAVGVATARPVTASSAPSADKRKVHTLERKKPKAS